MIARYSRPEMVEIWSQAAKFKIWFEIEAYATEKLADLGVVPKSAAENIWKNAKDVEFDVAKIDAIEAEVKKLHSSGISWKKLESFGLEYKYCALFLQNKITKLELEEQLLSAIKKYTKRQMTWWKRNKEIKWQRI